jgi:DNA invertase Pin-like site-specific DNA recombinase
VAPPDEARRGRAAIYLRVSTGNQVHGTSIDSQRDQCRGAATRHGYTVRGEFVDAGVSGAKNARPALDELLAAVMAGEVDAVVIARLDRLGRSLLHLLTLIRQLDAFGIRVISASDNIDTKTPAGRMMLQLLGVFAEFERERIRERSREGARRRVEDGGFVSSLPPFGYRAVPNPSGRRGVVLDIDPAAAACIREMYRLLIRHRTPVSIAARVLNDAGHRSATGIEWTQHTLSRWARGDGPATAAGVWRWTDLAVPIPAILTPEQHSEWVAWKAEPRSGRPIAARTCSVGAPARPAAAATTAGPPAAKPRSTPASDGSRPRPATRNGAAATPSGSTPSTTPSGPRSAKR